MPCHSDTWVPGHRKCATTVSPSSTSSMTCWCQSGNAARNCSRGGAELGRKLVTELPSYQLTPEPRQRFGLDRRRHRRSAAASSPATARQAPRVCGAGGAPPAAPRLRVPPAAPIDRIEPLEPIDRIEPADPIDSIDPADPIEATEPTDRAEQNDSADPTDAADSADPKERHDRTDPAERDDRYPTTPPTYRSGDRRVDALGLPRARGPRLPEADLPTPNWMGSTPDTQFSNRALRDGPAHSVTPAQPAVQATMAACQVSTQAATKSDSPTSPGGAP
jgi:hypothetical protein